MTPSKYTRHVSHYDAAGVLQSVPIDVYAVLKAFDVRCPAIQHAVKKLLCVGIRGHAETDLREAAASIARAIELTSEAS